jgi:glycosyltransferase involved in cell wall biosynthesis
VEDGVTGFWAKTPVEWEEKISVLIEDPLLREKLGKEGRKRVLEKYTVQSCAPRLVSILKRVIEKKQYGDGFPV